MPLILLMKNKTAATAAKSASTTFAVNSETLCDIKAERMFIGAVLTSGDSDTAAKAIAAIGNPESFYDHRTRFVFDSIVRLHALGEPPFVECVAEDMHNHGTLDKIGGIAEVKSIEAESGGVSAWWQQSAVKIVDLFKRRTAINKLRDTIAKAASPSVDIDSLRMEIEAHNEHADSHAPIFERRSFPVDSLPTTVRQMVLCAARQLQQPANMPAICALGAMSFALGKTLIEEPIRGRKTAGNLYLVGIATASLGKSESVKLMLPVVEQIASEEAEKWIKTASDLRREKAMLDQQVKDAKGNIDAGLDLRLHAITERIALGAPTLILEDTTIEKLENTLAANGEMAFIVSTEGKRVVQNVEGRNNKNGASDDSAWCKFWSRDRHRSNRLCRNVDLLEPCVSMLLFIQPHIAHEMEKSEEFYHSGFYGRMLLADTHVRPAFVDIDNLPLPVPSSVSRAWNDLVRQVYRVCRGSQTPPRVRMSLEALRVSVDMHNALVQSIRDGAHGTELILRRVENASRIALILHVMEHGDNLAKHEVSAETMRDAIAVLEFFTDYQDATISRRFGAKDDDKVKAVIAHLEEHGHINLNRIRLIFKCSNAKRAAVRAEELITKGIIKRDPDDAKRFIKH